MAIVTEMEQASSVESALVNAARIGDSSAFETLVAPYRRELHLHCYRLTGSLTDADDMLQESLLRAWRRIETYEGRAPLRIWLFRVATTTCLNELAVRRRRRRLWGPPDEPGGPPTMAEIDHLQPYPDRFLDEAADPAVQLDAKEAVSLAFIAAIQLLPPRQRAVLLLREVLTWSAREVADALDCSVASVNSALQRARSTLRARLENEEPRLHPQSVNDISERRTLARFMDAWERADFDALASILREDAVMAMPPEAQWFRGRNSIVEFFSTVPAAGHLEQIRLVPVGSNRQPAVAAYLSDPEDGGHLFYGLMVLTIRGDEITAITGFQDPGLCDYFGLPAYLSTTKEI
jgi:RNA polymerase sigma-70 factor, ECF subfamily